jgi:hypothetical protein
LLFPFAQTLPATYAPSRIILAQLEGSGRGALGAYDARAHGELTEALRAVPFKDGDAWLGELIKTNRLLGARGRPDLRQSTEIRRLSVDRQRRSGFRGARSALACSAGALLRRSWP